MYTHTYYCCYYFYYHYYVHTMYYVTNTCMHVWMYANIYNRADIQVICLLIGRVLDGTQEDATPSKLPSGNVCKKLVI